MLFRSLTVPPLQTSESVELALTDARQLAGHAGVVVVTGSIFLAAEARSLLTDTPAVPRAANA